jgi:hypothetical protein
MKIARLLTLTLLVGPALAQTGSFNEVPHGDVLHEAVLNNMLPEASSKAEPMVLPDAPVSQAPKVRVRVIDKKFIAVMAALGGAETYASSLTNSCWTMNSPPELPGSAASLPTNTWSLNTPPSMRQKCS